MTTTIRNEKNPAGRPGSIILGRELPDNDTEVARALQRRFANYSLIWDAVLPDLAFLEDCIHRASVLCQPIPGDDRTRLHCLTLKMFQLREALDYV